MKILILDDDETRLEAFAKKFEWEIPTPAMLTEDARKNELRLNRNKLHFARTAKDAIQLLGTECYDVVFLDHDLGGQVYVESGPGTGYEVAEWMAGNLKDCDPVVVIHTLNPAGRSRMRAVLPEAVLWPFAWMESLAHPGAVTMIDGPCASSSSVP